MDAVAGGALVRRAGPFVEGDQVDLGGDALDQFHQTVGVFVAVVYAVQHHVFKGDPFGVRDLGIDAQGVKQGFDVPFLVDRDQRVAHLVRCRVKADSQLAADFLRGAGDFGDDAGCGQRDAATRQSDAFAVHRDLHRVADVLEIIQRLAHAHQDDVRQHARAIITGTLPRLWPFAKVIASN